MDSNAQASEPPPIRGSKSAARALQILDYLNQRPEGARLERISYDLQINQETLRPYLKALIQWRKVSRTDGRYHRDLEASPDLAPAADEEGIQLALKRFVDETCHDVALVVLGPDGLVLTHYLNHPKGEALLHGLPLDSAHATAAGHALLWGRSRIVLKRYFSRIGMPRFTEQTPTTIEKLAPLLEPDRKKTWTAQGQYCETGACIAVLARPGVFTADRIALTTSVLQVNYRRDRDMLRDALLRTAGELMSVLGPLLPPASDPGPS